MAHIPTDTVIEALTRATPPRKEILRYSEHLTDAELIKHIVGEEISSKRLQLLVSVSRLLRLMDGLLSRRETGEGFVEKFSKQWLLIRDWKEDSTLEKEFDNLNEFYSDIQLFCDMPSHHREEPLLFGGDHLKGITQMAYERLKKKFSLSLSLRMKDNKVSGQ